MKFPTFELTDKVALVTGGSQGLGRGIALGLANAGADVCICARTEERVENTATEIENMGQRSIGIRADVSKFSDIEDMFKQITDTFGRIDILVNAAGTNQRMPSLELTEEVWDKIVDVNLKGTFFCCQAAGKIMAKQKKGKIINIGSLTSAIGIATIAPYSATKGGVLQLTRVLALEWAKYNINVNCIGPGYYQTELTQPLFDNPKWVESVLDQIAMDRPGLPEDLAGTAVFLASDASDYLTGEIIFVDGGFLAGWHGGLPKSR